MKDVYKLYSFKFDKDKAIEGLRLALKEKGFDNDPVRCPACRKARKQQRRNFDNKSASRSHFLANKNAETFWFLRFLINR